MTKVMRYENGKAIAGQVDAPFKVDWSDWINMTDAQKKGKKWLIENVPGAEGEIDAELFTPLWTNPNPTSQFAAQNITLASGDYDFLLILYTYAGDSHMSCQIAKKGQSVNLFTCGSTTVGTRVNNRSCDYVSDTSLSFGEGRQATGTSAAIAEHYVCTPMQIYGFKSTVKIKFDALAENVSTSASKCMLEDGETSVEDKITALDSRTTVYHKNFSGITDANGNVKVHTFNNDYIPIFANSKTNNYMAYIIFWQADHSFYCHFMGPSGNLASGVSVSGDVYFIPFGPNNNPLPTS